MCGAEYGLACARASPHSWRTCLLEEFFSLRRCPIKKNYIQVSKFPRAHNQFIKGSIFVSHLWCPIKKKEHRSIQVLNSQVSSLKSMVSIRTYYPQSFFWSSGEDPIVLLGNDNDHRQEKATKSLLCPSFTTANSCSVKCSCKCGTCRSWCKCSPVAIATTHDKNPSRTCPFAAAIATTKTKVGSGHLQWTWTYILPAGLSDDISIF